MRRDVVNLAPFDEQGRILMQRRDQHALMYPGCLSFFGGGKHRGEDHLAALTRELVEELEYIPHRPNLVVVHDYTYFKTHGTRRLYVEPIDTTQTLVQHEGYAKEWITPEAALGTPLGYWDRLALELLAIEMNHYS